MKGRRQVGGAWRRLRLGGAGNVAGEVRLVVSSRLSPVPSSSMGAGSVWINSASSLGNLALASYCSKILAVSMS